MRPILRHPPAASAGEIVYVPVRPRSSVGKGLARFFLWSCVGLFLVMFWAIGKEASERSATVVPPARAHVSDVTISDFRWTLGGFETRFMFSGRLRNAATVPVKDIELTCYIYAKSGTQIDQVRGRIYDRIPAGGSIKVVEHNLGWIRSQASTASCRPTDLVVID